MKPEIKTKWLEALRSGEYEQGRVMLKDSSSGTCTYCCLGVLTELYAQEHNLTFTGQGSHLKKEGPEEYLSSYPAQWAGLSSNTGRGSIQNTLAELNDAGETFEDIADYIEKFL